MGLANISIVGNVVRPPSQTEFPNGTKTTLVVAVNSYKKGATPDTRTAEFYKVEAWGKLADIAYKYIPKGSQITAIGRFSIDRWTGNDGRERSVGVINASEISLPPKRATLEDTFTTDPSSAPVDTYPSPPASSAIPYASIGTPMAPPATAFAAPFAADPMAVASTLTTVAPPSPVAPSSATAPDRTVATALGVEIDDYLTEAEEDAAAAEMYSKTLRVPPGKPSGGKQGAPSASKQSSKSSAFASAPDSDPNSNADSGSASTWSATDLLSGSIISDAEADELFGTSSGAA